MKFFYDLIIGLCCFKSTKQTTKLIQSANGIKGDILFTVTTILPEDTADLHSHILGETKHDIMLIQSNIDARYFSQNWGFVWCFNHNIHSTFWGTMDDDTEFLGDGDLIDQLYLADRTGFSVAGFMSSSHPYAGYGGLADIGNYKSLLFVDGHNMFSHYNDNVVNGLCDSWGEGNISYVEVEYCNRLKFLTGKPILAIKDRSYIHHTFRSEPSINALRTPNEHRDMENGGRLFQEKYGIYCAPSSPGFSWQNIVEQIGTHTHEDMRKHIVYGGMSNLQEIYNKFNKEFEIVYA